MLVGLCSSQGFLVSLRTQYGVDAFLSFNRFSLYFLYSFLSHSPDSEASFFARVSHGVSTTANSWRNRSIENRSNDNSFRINWEPQSKTNWIRFSLPSRLFPFPLFSLSHFHPCSFPLSFLFQLFLSSLCVFVLVLATVHTNRKSNIRTRISCTSHRFQTLPLNHSYVFSHSLSCSSLIRCFSNDILFSSLSKPLLFPICQTVNSGCRVHSIRTAVFNSHLDREKELEKERVDFSLNFWNICRTFTRLAFIRIRATVCVVRSRNHRLLSKHRFSRRSFNFTEHYFSGQLLFCLQRNTRSLNGSSQSTSLY